MKPEIRSPKSEPEAYAPSSGESDDLQRLSAFELAFWDVSSSVFDYLTTAEIDGLVREDSPQAKIYDLSERTVLFGEEVIRLAKRIPCNPTNNRLIDQFVGSGTSIGANYCEADDSISTGDLRHRISICRKESKEARFWLRMIATAEPSLKDNARILWREATELSLIFGSIWRRLGEPKK